ncbi:MAG: IscS subfamily cysteine desulfurase [Alphaproteobacteria bacterium]|nr:IscS subfamily cysteine desulfurase [Alphaproteobacteria bacterium]
MNIYMDYQATTPCDKRVVEEMFPYFTEKFGNPHSGHAMGLEANDAVDDSRRKIADLIKAKDSREIVFTSGATESNNLAIRGAVHYYKSDRKKIITSTIEHKCVLETFRSLRSEGYQAVFAPVLSNGIVDMDFLKKEIDDDTILVSIMSVNNEIGTIQPIKEISKLCREHGVLFHTDAAQAVGKVEVDAGDVDLMSISGHKIYGPKGVGALYVRIKPRIRLAPLFSGGGQERGIRSGTLPVPLCVGLGKACEIAKNEMVQESRRLTEMKNYFIDKILSRLEKVYLNGDRERRIPGCLNFSFEGVEGESIMLGMPEVCISSGSACTSASLEPSYVLKAISIREDLAHCSLRIGLGRFTTFDEVEYVSDKIIETVTRLRSMSPLW